MSSRIFGVFLLLLLGTSCVSLADTSRLSDQQRLAVCASQKYLRKNGYLEHIDGIDSSRLDLELWDTMTYSKNGTMDWKALLNDRAGHFSNKLYAVKNDGRSFLVVYRETQGYSCVRVGSDRSDIHLIEANCKPVGALIRVREDLIQCD